MSRVDGQPDADDQRPTGWNVILNVADFDAVTSFYRDILNLPVKKSWDAPAGPGMIFHLGPDSIVEFIGPPYPERQHQTPARGVEVMIRVGDAAAWLEGLTAAGVTIERELVENSWGGRSFGIDDPSGLRVWMYDEL